MTDKQLPTVLNDDLFPILEKKAIALSKSKVIPVALRGNPYDVLAILLYGAELNIPAMQALNSINVISGVPTLSAQLMVALIRRDVPTAIIEITDSEDINKPHCSCFMARSAEMRKQGHTAYWDMPKADKMILANKDNYKKQPQTMLRWRAVAESARMVFPDVIKGMYFPDELGADTNELGEVEVQTENLKELVSKDDLRALVVLMKDAGFTSGQVKAICLEYFKIGDSSKLTRGQYRELITKLKELDPSDVKGGEQ